jgi:hypothetical protein
MTDHPHVRMIVPGGGISLDGKSWISCRPGFFLPVRVLSRLFRRLFLEKLIATHKANRLKFFGDHAALADARAFAAYLAPNGCDIARLPHPNRHYNTAASIPERHLVQAWCPAVVRRRDVDHNLFSMICLIVTLMSPPSSPTWDCRARPQPRSSRMPAARGESRPLNWPCGAGRPGYRERFHR